MNNARAFEAFMFQDLSNGVLGAQFGACFLSDQGFEHL
jgi:hypothetical protein